MSSDRVSLVIFDCDGVLIDSEIISARILIDLLAERGVHVDLDYVQRNFLGRSFPKVAEEIRTSLKYRLPDDFEAHYRSNLLAAFETELRTVAGIEAVLDDLGVASCVATSSSPPRAKRSLELAGLSAFFGDRLFTASEVANGKPAPDLFFHAAERMGASPRNTLVIEDSLPGLKAARAAGMQVLHFTGAGHMLNRTSSLPDDLADVPAFDNWADFYDMAPLLKRAG